MRIGSIMTALVALTLSAFSSASAQTMNSRTYCNPLNVDYTYMIYDSERDISYRSGADPAVVEFRGEYYMFVTRSMGYWHSTDLLNWEFIQPEKWYFEGSNAPAAFNYKDSVLYVTGNPSGNMSILYTDNPKKGDWKGVASILYDLQDPALFIDDDGQAYMFWGSSNTYPLRGKKLDRNRRFHVDGPTHELFKLDMDKHGWERFGENHADTTLAGYMEGAWLTKHNGKYYMQYGAPGTEFNVYADGVYMADNPLGPYTYAPNNPVSYKAGGWMNGAGHGSTVVGPGGNYWHFASMALSANVNWERRLCMFPTYFDKDGLMYSDCNFGDYPRYAPADKGGKSQFTGWMLLSYKRPVKASSVKEGYSPENIVDEEVKSFWLAESNGSDEWIEIDLGKASMVHAVQVNYYDYKSDMYTKDVTLRHRYRVEGSIDGTNWFSLVDRSNSYKDRPNDYVELDQATKARYVRYSNIEIPTPNLAISDIRVFGIGGGKVVDRVEKLNVFRGDDRRDAKLTWNPVKGAQGYNIRWGIAPDKLYNSWLVYEVNEMLLKSLTTDQSYYFTVEAFSENGVGEAAKLIKVD
ncbi:MAG: family 43 glycosylhydrolase [Bacteroidales bacterium]